MCEEQIREKIKLEVLKHVNKIAKIPNKDYDCFDCEQLINTVFRDLFHFSIRQGGFGKSNTTKVLTSPIGVFYDCSFLTLEEKRGRIAAIHTGDILFFHTQSLEENAPTFENRYPGHVALYLGNNLFIHAKASSGRVLISNFMEEDYLEIFVGFKNLVPFILHLQENSNILSL